MAYLTDLLGEGEVIVFQSRPHWFILFARVLAELVLLCLLVAAAVFASAFDNPSMALIIRLAAAALGVIVVISAFIDYWRWSNQRYIVTDRQVMQLRGIFNKSVLNSSLEKITDVAMHQSMFGRMFNYGDIDILTANEEGIDRMVHISDPVQFKRAMLDSRARYDRHIGPSTNQVQSPDANSPQMLLQQLAALHNSGILDDAEFEAKKREVLSRI